MRIITWNCNGAFRKKNHLFDSNSCDVLIVQECENPQVSTKAYQEWAADNYLWIGNNKNKGLGVFCQNKFKLEKLDWSDINTNYKNEQLQSFLPCSINGEYILLAVWTKKANSEVFGYMGQFWKYLQLHKEKLKEKKVIIAGDFNSNVIWDKWDRWWNHTDVVNELDEIGIRSVYHELFEEEQGQESHPTFYLHRSIDKPYHIDYIFASKEFVSLDKRLTVGTPKEWLAYSDHMPLELVINGYENLKGMR